METAGTLYKHPSKSHRSSFDSANTFSVRHCGDLEAINMNWKKSFAKSSYFVYHRGQAIPLEVLEICVIFSCHSFCVLLDAPLTKNNPIFHTLFLGRAIWYMGS